MKTAREGVEHALGRLELARKVMRTPTNADAEHLNKALDYAWGYIATAMASLNRTLEMLSEEEGSITWAAPRSLDKRPYLW